MIIVFRSRKLEKTFSTEENLTKAYGARMAKAVMIRIAILRRAQSLEMVPSVPPERRHQLIGRRKGQYAVDLVHPHRLVFEPANEPLPQTEDGGIDLTRVTAIMILGVVDYH